MHPLYEWTIALALLALILGGPVWLLLPLCAVIVFMPPSLDPAIRWKERNEKRRRSRQ